MGIEKNLVEAIPRGRRRHGGGSGGVRRRRRKEVREFEKEDEAVCTVRMALDQRGEIEIEFFGQCV
ncbi:hypothetical protein TSUD_09940 [Trifolium subterraneum]|nr:hypothetical protein TSUD_09940 [Trifolium subterraneum]